MSQRTAYAEARVVATEQVTLRMRRITFAGDGLAGFVSVAPDQFVKLFFARDGGVPEVPAFPDDGDLRRWFGQYAAIPEAQRPWMRTYTVRRHLAGQARIEIDFALHEGENVGPASRWVAAARSGHVIGLAGPKASHRHSTGGHDWRLLVGDETALPAIGALVESLSPDERVVVYAEVADEGEEQRWATPGEVEVHWVHAGPSGPDRPPLLLEAIREATLPSGEGFVWAAGESSTVRAVRHHLVVERGLDKRAVSISPYWRVGRAEGGPLTPEDIAERAERIAEAGGESAVTAGALSGSAMTRGLLAAGASVIRKDVP